MSFHVLNQYRYRHGPWGSDDSVGNNGAFHIPNPFDRKGPPFRVIASDGMGWEHISMSLPHRCPTWEETCWIKSLHWEEEDCVVQYHPPRSEYVNQHPFCLHLWRPTEGHALPMPPSILVGIKVPA